MDSGKFHSFSDENSVPSRPVMNLPRVTSPQCWPKTGLFISFCFILQLEVRSVSCMQHRNLLSEPQRDLAFGIGTDSARGLRPWRGTLRPGDFHQGCCLSHQRDRHGPQEDRQMNTSSLVKAKVRQQISKWFRQTESIDQMFHDLGKPS